MKIGILKTGDVMSQMIPEHGEYPDMFQRLLGAVDPSIDFVTVDVVGGGDLGNPGDADGWLVTGSRHGVYDDLPWIEPLKAFLRRALDEKIPVVGVCFGHQILAEAMGGKAEKSQKGWGLGPHDYAPGDVPAWMAGMARNWSGHAVHQDQVTALPPDTTVLAGSDFCNYAALAYGDVERPLAISVQSHPEFDEGFMRALIDVRLREIVPADQVAIAEQKLGARVDNPDWAKVMVEFFRRGARQAK